MIGLITLFIGFLLFTRQTQAACVSPSGPNFDQCPAGKYCYVNSDWGISSLWCCDTPQQCTQQQTTGGSDTTGTGTGNLPSGNSGNNKPADSKVADVCGYVDATKQGSCRGCMANGQQVWTAIGCIPTTPQGIFNKFFTLGIGMAGGIAFLLILFGGFQVLTSTGNPEQLNAGRELIGSAITGLLLVIFSVFILRLIGYNILGLPGFG